MSEQILASLKNYCEPNGLKAQQVLALHRAGRFPALVRIGRRWFVHLPKADEFFRGGGAGWDGGWRKAAGATAEAGR